MEESKEAPSVNEDNNEEELFKKSKVFVPKSKEVKPSASKEGKSGKNDNDKYDVPDLE